MGRRGFTLIESLVVLAVLAIIAAIAAPSLLGRRPTVHFDNALDRTRSALTMARARAMETRAPVSVYASWTSDSAPVRLFMTGPDAEDHHASTRRGEQPVDPMSLHALPDDEPDGWKRVLIDLPPGVRLVREEELEELAAAAAASRDSNLDTLVLPTPEPALPTTDQRLRLGVFLPDGSAAASAPGALISQEGQVARIRISGATGVASIERLGLLSSLDIEALEEAEAGEPEDDADVDATDPPGGDD